MLTNCYRQCQQYSKEQWDEKITDSINYFLILCAIVEEELNEEN